MITKTTSFVKVVGSGNDFILIDGRSPFFRQKAPQFAKIWCDRKRGVGADGLLWVSNSRRADARMRIFNPDGSEAAMCGNGLRCVGWYLHVTDHRKSRWAVETGAGVIPIEVIGSESVRAFVSPPRRLRLGLKVLHRTKCYTFHSIHAGVPHAVHFVSKLDSVDLGSLGPYVRNHRLFKPEGTNVNLVRIDSAHRIAIRTYERGVEGETLACGTGAVAAALIGTALGRLTPPIQVATRSGEPLRVGFRQILRPWEGLYLEGPARILFAGVLPHA